MLKIALRTLAKNKLYTLLNVGGLAVSMAAVMLIALWVQNELRFDRFHRNADQIFRVKTDLNLNNNETWVFGNSPMRIHELTAQIPGVVSTAQIFKPFQQKAFLRLGGDIFEEKDYGYVSKDWFSMLDYDFAEGNAHGFGDRPDDVILTESLANKLFGNRAALGATVRIDSVDFIVHAVLRDPRAESSFRENLLLPLSARLNNAQNRANDEDWGNFMYYTFVQLRPGTAPEEVGRKLTPLLNAAAKDSTMVSKLGALTALHFDREVKDDTFEKGDRRLVGTFSLIGLLILIMAAINYISLTTARAQTRAKEAGIRKIVGANRGQLFGQFLCEAALLSVGAGVLSLLLIKMGLPWFSEIAGRTFTLPWNSPLVWILISGTLLSTILCAGIYPALLMAGFSPMQVLRGAGGRSGQIRPVVRQGLVIVQFTISVALLVCTIVISQQRAFIQNKDLGYDREQVFMFTIKWWQYRLLGKERGENLVKNIEQNLRQSTAVADVCRANSSPTNIDGSHVGSVRFDKMPENANFVVSQLAADAHFARLFNLKMADGRWFEPNSKVDDNNVVLNETAARSMGLPQPWVGQRFGFHGREGKVVGIVRDFHFLPLREAIKPLVVFHSASNWKGNIFVKTQPGKTAEALAATEAIWKQFIPQYPLEMSFVDEDFNRLYRAEQQAGLLFNCFAGIAIFIACLGLFGLATFTAAQRTKEIGIRKVLGASVAGITALLAKDFLILVLLAVVIATPIAWYATWQWLSGFAYRIDLQWWMFAGAALLAVGVAVLTIGFQSVKAALANPVKSLRSE
jgi:putative ABC transport system permease protein